jgi:hypothetical protein
LAERAGAYQITVFTDPTPLCAGPVDITVLVQDAATGEPASDVQVSIKAGWRGAPDSVTHPATREAATNKLFYAANFDLPEPGWYTVEVSVTGARGEAQVHFELEAAQPLPPFVAMWPWLGWPALAILLFGAHQVVVRRAQRRSLGKDAPARAGGRNRDI